MLLLGGIAALCASRALGSPPPEMLFARVGSDEGLSSGAIMAIVQDAQGFLWFGTEDGLDRFDGYELRHFIHKPADAGTLPNNWIAALASDPSGRLWIGSDGGGLVWRDAGLGQFRPPTANDGQPLTDPSARIRAIHVDRGGRLWIATRGAGVRCLDIQQQRSTEYRHDPANPGSLSDDSVFAIAEDAFGKMWIGTATGLDRLDPQSGRIEQFGARLRAAGVPADAAVKVNALYSDVRGILWIGLDAGLARLDVPAAAFTMLTHRDGDPSALPDGRITALLEDDAQRFWVGTSVGLALLDRRTDTFVTLRHDPTNRSSLPDGNITSLYQDRSGLLWIGTKTGGVARWNPRSWSFGHHRLGEDAADRVTSFAVDRRGMLWVGSFGAGAASIDPVSGAVKGYRRGNSPSALHDDTVMALVTDDRNRAWLGTMSSGIDRIDPARGEIVHFNFIPTDNSTLPAPGVMSLLRDTKGRIWVGTYGGGLARIDPDSDRVVRYAHGRDDATALSGDRATALAEDRSGLIWIGTDGSGLNVLDPASGRFAHFVHDPKNPTSLAADIIYAVHVDDAGAIWVGTRGGGLDRVLGAPFGHDRLRFENLSESDGLPNGTVYGIESDATGKLWVSTNLGLAAVQPVDRSVRSFRRSHGLQGDEFNFGAHYRAPDGTLYFGGANGYNAFLPERLQFNQKPPPVVLTDVLKLNTRISQTPEMLRELDLGFRDSVVTFQFAALDFTGPAENSYAYRLEGFDTVWIKPTGAGRQATYTNLAGGDYVFRVRAANSDGRWSETPLALRVRVAPPPWATWWARTLYGMGSVAILFLAWLGQHRRVLREAAYARRLKEEVDVRTRELAERNRDMERANQQLHEASVSDSLTGLGNRRCLQDAIAALLAKPVAAAGAASRPRFVLMVIDLDYLKPINDEYGHAGGDALLVQFADTLRRVFRHADLIVRWGGDEFVVLCLDADLTAASAQAERVRSFVAKQIFRVGGGNVARTSCSIGFATVPFIPGNPQLLDWEHSLSIADIALYEAKRERNTWVGWAGTEKTAQLPSVSGELAANHAALERDGFLVVQRRPWCPEETVDRLRTPRRPGKTIP